MTNTTNITANNTHLHSDFDPTAAQSGAWVGFPGLPVKEAVSPGWSDAGTRHWYQAGDGAWYYRLTSKGFALAKPEDAEALTALTALTALSSLSAVVEFKYYDRPTGSGMEVCWDFRDPTTDKLLLSLTQFEDGKWRTDHHSADPVRFESPKEAILAEGGDPSQFPLPTGWDWGVVEYPSGRILSRHATKEEAWEACRGLNTYQPFPIPRETSAPDETLSSLKSQYPALSFSVIPSVTFARNEDAVYMGAPPVNQPTPGPFIKIQNPMGGADYVRPDDTERLHATCRWHQSRAAARGF